MEIKYSVINKIKGSMRKQKAVTMALCLKMKCSRNSTIKYYNPNKIHNLIGISPNTFKTYLPLMVEMELVEFSGKNNEHLVIRSLKSSKKARNICVDSFCFDSYAEAYKSLRSYVMLLIQKRKDYIRTLLQAVADPKLSEAKDWGKIRKKVKKLVRKGVIRSKIWVDNGTSYKRIAKEVGCCIRTAQRVVKYAVDKGWVNVHKNFQQMHMPGVHYREVPGFTFTTLNYGYCIGANIYTLTDKSLLPQLCQLCEDA